VNTRAAYARFLASASGSASGNSHDRRRTRRERRRRRQMQQTKEQFQVKLTKEEQRRFDERREFVDAAVSYLSNYSWSYFVTLTFRQQLGPEAIERAIKRFARFVHQNVFGEFDPVRDVRDLYGVRYFPAIERGRHGTQRLHAHVLICGGEILGERLTNARWDPWRKWWNKEYGGLQVDPPESQDDVAAYCAKYILKGDESSFELHSTWADERDRRMTAEAPLLEERKIGIDVTRSAELEKTAFRGEAPHGTGPTSKGSGKVCHRCGLVSLCRCWTGTSDGEAPFPPAVGPAGRDGWGGLAAESGQVVTTPESDAGSCNTRAPADPAPSPQLELRMQEQLALPLHDSANKSGHRFSSRREKRLQRRREYERQACINAASKCPSGN